ncbi:MAG: hypothetical protein HOY79_17620 [Streptomyces sp.]|nr:hypothetical protein [Streptomyces sp.]
MATTPRRSYGEAKCSYCGKEIALKKDRTFRYHLMPKDGRYRPPECIGTGEKPMAPAGDAR